MHAHGTGFSFADQYYHGFIMQGVALDAGSLDAGSPVPDCRCGHCKHLTPEYKKLGEAVAADPKLKNRVVVAKVCHLPPCTMHHAAS